MAEKKQTSLNLGEYIGQAIKKDGRTGDQIAAAVGIDSSYLSRIKAGQSPGSAVLEALIQELALDPETARRLASEAASERRTEKMQRRLQLIEKHLGRAAGPRVHTLPVLVMDAEHGAFDVPMQILQGPEIDPDGEVYFRLRITQVTNLPERFFLEVVFLLAIPSPDCVTSVKIGTRERRLLGAATGFELRVSLPTGTGASFTLQRGMIGAFAFRIRPV